ncbi:MAG TPA: winged helix-turn-helix domain-containing protein [Usitatibacter sp.]|nr:winged helix-turn-helix domain-containing protein [Usitatibacter sp.]
MSDTASIARIAELFADPARASMVWTLIDGTMRPAGELAWAANVSPQSASGHLAKLVEGGLLAVESQGRHRYFRISGAEVAATIEGLASLGAAKTARAPRTAARPAAEPVEFLNARTCYGHLAGEMAVRILGALREARWLESEGPDLRLTRRGEAALKELGIDVDAARQSRRMFARCCVDLTQRRPHLGGALGDALLDAFVQRGWVIRRRGSRVVSISPAGHAAFARHFGI